jgi:hypothetical protein
MTKTRAWANGHSVANPPPELSLYSMCKEFHCLPDSGGWNDQDPQICASFKLISGIVAEEENKRAKKK